jgi:hypothetical protein
MLFYFIEKVFEFVESISIFLSLKENRPNLLEIRNKVTCLVCILQLLQQMQLTLLSLKTILQILTNRRSMK